MQSLVFQLVDGDDKEDIAEYAKIIRTNNELLPNLINDVPDLSQKAGRIDDFVMTAADRKDLPYDLARPRMINSVHTGRKE